MFPDTYNTLCIPYVYNYLWYESQHCNIQGLWYSMIIYSRVHVKYDKYYLHTIVYQSIQGPGYKIYSLVYPWTKLENAESTLTSDYLFNPHWANVILITVNLITNTGTSLVQWKDFLINLLSLSLSKYKQKNRHVINLWTQML